jgi:hypothetical protein
MEKVTAVRLKKKKTLFSVFDMQSAPHKMELTLFG